MSNDGRHLTLVSTDIEQLENFNKAIGRTIAIKLHHGGKLSLHRKQGYRVQFSDIAYYQFLLSIGLTPKKSRIIPALNIPNEYYGHFLRGLFDGDGTTYAYNDPRWPTSYLYYVGFASASPIFLDYLAKMNMKLFGTGAGAVRKHKGASSLYYAKKDGYKVYRGMYSESGDLWLSRKRHKLEAFILIANSGIILNNARVVEW